MSARFRFILLKWPQTARAQAMLIRELAIGFEYECWKHEYADLNNTASGWAEKPRFRYTSVPRKGALFAHIVRVDRSTPGGQHWWWVNYGTGEDGPQNAPYPIQPVQAPALKFVVPYQPKTIPPAGLGYNPSAPRETVITQYVEHPGIRARDWSTALFKKYTDRHERYGFYQVIKRAGARAWAKL